jgi:hypothetical protein
MRVTRGPTRATFAKRQIICKMGSTGRRNQKWCADCGATYNRPTLSSQGHFRELGCGAESEKLLLLCDEVRVMSSSISRCQLRGSSGLSLKRSNPAEILVILPEHYLLPHGLIPALRCYRCHIELLEWNFPSYRLISQAQAASVKLASTVFTSGRISRSSIQQHSTIHHNPSVNPSAASSTGWVGLVPSSIEYTTFLFISK